MAPNFSRPTSRYPDSSSHLSLFAFQLPFSQADPLLLFTVSWEMLLVNHLYFSTEKSMLGWEIVLSSVSVKGPNLVVAEASEWLFVFGLLVLRARIFRGNLSQMAFSPPCK